MIVQIVLNGSDQCGHILEGPSPDPFLGEVSEPSLHHVQPGTGRRNKVQVKPRMATEPGVHAGMFVRAIIVDDKMQIQVAWGVAIDFLQEPDKFLVPMARHTVADHRAVEHAEGGEQGGGAMALVIVRQRPAAPFLHREARLGAVEGLDLAFLVDAQDQGLVWRIQIQPHHIVQFVEELGVAAELEGLEQMRLELVLSPDPPNGGLAEALGLGHTAGTPMGGMRRGLVQGRFDDGAHFADGNPWNPSRPRRVLFQAGHAQGQKPLPPQLDGGARNLHPASDILAGPSVCRQSDDLGPLDQSQGQAPAACPGLQGGPLFGGQDNRHGGSAHGEGSYTDPINCQAISDALH